MPSLSEASSERTSTFHFCERGEAQVHVVEDAGEQVGLVAADGAADLHDHVATLVGVLGQQERLDPLLERRSTCASDSSTSWRISSRSSPDASVSISRAVATSSRAARQLVPGPDDLAELLVPARQVAQRSGSARVAGSARSASTASNSASSAAIRSSNMVSERCGRDGDVRATAAGTPAPPASRVAQSCVRRRSAGVALALPLRSP